MRTVRVLDSLRTQRSNYSTSENITLAADVYSADAAGRVNFTFTVLDPSQKVVFTHTGNSIPGTVGAGGGEVGNVPIGRFYTTSGNYTLQAGATTDTGQSATGSSVFSVFSPVIVLSYPSNGAQDLSDQMLTFRWVGSGASKYRISVCDNQSFYNTPYTAETIDTSITYPQNPTDSRQRLVGGKVYYWKVEGLDGLNNQIAVSPTPFAFTVKQTGSSSSTRDLAVSAITLGQDAVAPQINVKVDIKNTGGSSESNISVTLYAGGMVYGTQKIDLINTGETKTLSFSFEPPAVPDGQPLFVSATHSLYDDNIQNNILTTALQIKAPPTKPIYGKILGRVTAQREKGEGSGIEDVRIRYSGPAGGEVFTGSGGQYKIDDLPEGTYAIKATHPEYEPAELTVNVEKGKPSTNSDLAMVKRKAPVYSAADIWQIIKDNVSKEIAAEFDGYDLKEIRGVDRQELNELIGQLKDKKAKVTEATVGY